MTRTYYASYGKNMTADSSVHGMFMHECSDPARALALRALVEARDAQDNYAEGGVALYMLFCHIGMGEKDGDEDALYDQLGPCPPGVKETLFDLATEECQGPYDDVILYFLNANKLY